MPLPAGLSTILGIGTITNLWTLVLNQVLVQALVSHAGPGATCNGNKAGNSIEGSNGTKVVTGDVLGTISATALSQASELLPA